MSKASDMAANLTARELEFLVAYVKEATGAVDWQKVADATNSKTAKYARDQFAQVRKKLLRLAPSADGDASDAATDGVGATPNGKAKAKGTPKKRKGGSDADDEGTPKQNKKAKTNSKKGDDAVVKEEPNEAGQMMDELN